MTEPTPLDQQQFLDVIDCDEAHRRFREALGELVPRPEVVALHDALGRVLLEDVVAPVDVPNFDRSNVDGFALRAADTWGAEEESPITLALHGEVVTPGVIPETSVAPGAAVPIATGAPVPRGADAVVMVEYTERDGDSLQVRRAAVPGANITFAGTDITRGEIVVRKGELLTARETGVIAAVGLDRVTVARRPIVAILSTGDELIAPGATIRPGEVFDSNSTILAGSVVELGGEPRLLGVAADDESVLRQKLREALDTADVVLLSGGTSKGAGDVSYRVIEELGPPGIVVHGVALKPGKPICMAVVQARPVVILPGFPTSAIFTFHEFVAPVILAMGGRSLPRKAIVRARLPHAISSERGRTEYMLVSLIAEAEPGSDDALPVAWPIGKGSGSVTTFSRADGVITIPRQHEMLDEGEIVEVRLLGDAILPSDLLVVGSPCAGLDCVLQTLRAEGIRSKTLYPGRAAGVRAATRGECDVAAVEIEDAYDVGEGDLETIRAWRRVYGVAFRAEDARFVGKSPEGAVRQLTDAEDAVMVNRSHGSAARRLTDELLEGRRPHGYTVESKSDRSVAAALAQGRADWGICLEHVALEEGLGFLPVEEVVFGFLIPRARLSRLAVRRFLEILESDVLRETLRQLGFRDAR
jgi:putative molybdopterin biosynthesis protein